MKNNESSTNLENGDLFNRRYRIEQTLQETAYRSAYTAVDVTLDRLVVVKFLKDKPSNTDESLKRFLLEAKRLSNLKHRNIVSVLDSGFSPKPHIVTAFIPGPSLRKIIDDGAYLSIDSLLECFTKIADALAYVHSNGLVHRNIKPENIIFSSFDIARSEPILIDFGISIQIHSDEHITVALNLEQELRGSVPYISPEVFRGETPDQKSDIYSLGCCLFEAMYKRPVFHVQKPAEWPEKHCNSIPVVPHDLAVSAQEKWLKSVILKTLEKEPSNRYQTCDEIKAALHDISSGVAPRTHSRAHSTTWSITFKMAAVLTSGAFILLALALWPWLSQEAKKKPISAMESKQYSKLLSQWRPLVTKAVEAYRQRNIPAARQHIQKALVIASQIGQNSDELARSFRVASTIEYLDAKYDKAETLASEALKIHEKILKPGQFQLSKTLEILGVASSGKKEFGKAIFCLQQVVDITLNDSSLDEREALPALLNLATAQQKANQTDNAAINFNLAKEIALKDPGQCRFFLAEACFGLSVLSTNKSDYKTALADLAPAIDNLDRFRQTAVYESKLMPQIRLHNHSELLQRAALLAHKLDNDKLAEKYHQLAFTVKENENETANYNRP